MSAIGKITSNQLQVGTVILTEQGRYPSTRKGESTVPMQVTGLDRIRPENGGRVRVRVTMADLEGGSETVANTSPSQTWWLAEASAYWRQRVLDKLAELVEVPVDGPELIDQHAQAAAERLDPEQDDWQDRHPHAAIVYGNRATTKIPEPGWYSQCRAPGCSGHWRTGLPTEQVAREVYEQHVFHSSQCCPDSQPTSKPAVWEEAQEFYGGPAAATGSAVVAALEQMCEAVRANHPELPPLVVVTGSGFYGPARWGHTRHGGWTDRRNQVTQDGVTTSAKMVEVFVAGECLARGAQFTLETILHELAHVLAGARGVQDTSRQGRWHNQQFRKLAEELGLEYPKDQAHPQVGFSECVLTPGTVQEYADQIEQLDRAVRLAIDLPGFLDELVGQDGQQLVGGEFVHHGRRRKGTDSSGHNTNNLRATCRCEPVRIIRVSRKVFGDGFIACGLCHQSFELADEDR